MKKMFYDNEIEVLLFLLKEVGTEGYCLYHIARMINRNHSLIFKSTKKLEEKGLVESVKIRGARIPSLTEKGKVVAKLLKEISDMIS